MKNPKLFSLVFAVCFPLAALAGPEPSGTPVQPKVWKQVTEKGTLAPNR
jgi:hypothetical protein